MFGPTPLARLARIGRAGPTRWLGLSGEKPKVTSVAIAVICPRLVVCSFVHGFNDLKYGTTSWHQYGSSVPQNT